MENSEVIQNETPVKDGPIQQDVAPIQEAPVVLNESTPSIYSNAKAPTTVVGEKDHASEIASNVLGQEETNKTYDYTSQAGKEYDKSIQTKTTQSTGATMSGEFKDQYGMQDAYKATANEDYSWNKLAKDMAQTKYDQEAAQARFQSIQEKQQIDAAASKAWNNYFSSEYSANQTQDKMGWSGGQEQSSELQVSFLQAETASNMYTQDEMHKYGVETKLGTARMYADAEQKTLALKFYQDARDQAVREAELTGYYVPPEASEMFKQQDIANKILEDPSSSADAKARAQQVNAACKQYYRNLGFEEGYRYDSKTGKVVTEFYGIKTLSQLNHEETVRNNKVNEELQKQANDIAKAANGIAAQGNRLAAAQLRVTQVMQNSIETRRIFDEGKKVTSKSKYNWYKDDKGHAKYITPGDKMYRIDNKYFIAGKDSNGTETAFPVYNSDKEHAMNHAGKSLGDKNFNNYMAFPGN